jgi:hypothetical protein
MTWFQYEATTWQNKSRVKKRLPWVTAFFCNSGSGHCY